jgi:hypothetical protein
VVIDQVLDATGLLIREGPSGADGAPGPIAGEGGRAAGGVRGYPVIFPCNFGYLNGGCFKRLGFNLLSI